MLVDMETAFLRVLEEKLKTETGIRNIDIPLM